MKRPEYATHERDYKVAAHIVISALFDPKHVDSDGLPALLANVFGPEPDLGKLGLTHEELRQVEHGLENIGLRGAFTNLCEGRWGYPQFTWIPEAVAKGFGPDIADTFRALVDASQPLVKRIDDFRVDLTNTATQSEQHGVVVQSKDLRISLAFAALILGGYDPLAYSFYHAGAMRNAFERYAPRFEWPAARCSRGEAYVDVCTFVASIDLALRTHGVPVQDFIDAQSFIWLRFYWGDNEPWSTTRKPVRRRHGSVAIGEDQRER